MGLFSRKKKTEPVVETVKETPVVSNDITGEVIVAR